MPVVHLLPVQDRETPQSDIYRCPVYKVRGSWAVSNLIDQWHFSIIIRRLALLVFCVDCYLFPDLDEDGGAIHNWPQHQFRLLDRDSERQEHSVPVQSCLRDKQAGTASGCHSHVEVNA